MSAFQRRGGGYEAVRLRPFTAMAVIAGVAVTVAAMAAIGGVDWRSGVIIEVVSERLGARLTTRCQLLGSLGSFRALRRRKILNIETLFACF